MVGLDEIGPASGKAFGAGSRIEPSRGAIRGGTDGAVLSERGLLTPNIFTGGQEYHSVREWISVQDMAVSAATLVELAKLWAEPEWADSA